MGRRIFIVLEDDDEEAEQFSGATIEKSKRSQYKWAVTDKLSARTVYVSSWDDAMRAAFGFTGKP